MKVNKEDVLKIAQLAKLSFGENEVDTFTEQFQRMLTYVETLNKVDTTGVPPTAHVVPAADEGAFRLDASTTSLAHEDAVAMAPDQCGGHFGVPKIID
ncbi:MAG: Asp-tRNA(Asn)/Glu-tRNA(Gln) amidotransferase subunit GatC [Acidobacteria bacterium]|nr:Asp-tRNA(Asn)/Glu-tRNA(Gln) amidotransferase subunit GatC [Acidobacteriota bacterium]MBI3656963.1 Asp-tRNA(Asn)/Glu-tRNA(Gln) amidotransferase subunit GatC [Acidobacteriota bacterium]